MSDLRAILTRSPELLAVLEDVNVPYLHINPLGRYEFSKLGRHRTGPSPIAQDVHGELCAVLDIMGGTAIFQEWSLRLLRGSDWAHRRRATVLIERLPASIVDRLPKVVLEELKLASKRGGYGIIFGPPGCSKSSILAWLALQLPEEPVLLVSENPPVDIPGNHVTHVFPPTSTSEDRALQRLIRISPNVFWDRIHGLNDLQTSIGFGTGRRRWFGADFADPEKAAFFLASLSQFGLRIEWDAILTLSPSVIGRPEVTNFATRQKGAWTHHVGKAALNWISDLPQISASIPEVELPLPFPTSPSFADLDSPLTIPVDPMENIPADALEEMSEDFADFDQKTGMLSHEHFQASRRTPAKTVEFVEPTESGDNVPEITRQYPRTFDSRPSSPVPEPTRTSGFHPIVERPKTGFNPVIERPKSGFQQVIERPVIQRNVQPDVSTQNTSSDILRHILPMLRDEPNPPVNLDDLRITMSGQMHQTDIDASKDEHTGSQPIDMLDYVDFEIMDDEGDDYSSVSEAFDDDIASMFSEDIATSVASDANYAVYTWPKEEVVVDSETTRTGRISDPSLLASITESSMEREDATEEVNLGDRLRMIRDRFQRKD